MRRLFMAIMLGLGTHCQAQLNVLSLEAVKVGNESVFVVEIERLANMTSIAGKDPAMRGPTSPDKSDNAKVTTKCSSTCPQPNEQHLMESISCPHYFLSERNLLQSESPFCMD